VLLHFQVTDVNYADFLTIQKKYQVRLGETCPIASSNPAGIAPKIIMIIGVQ
jgi:hypothetical protein